MPGNVKAESKVVKIPARWTDGEAERRLGRSAGRLDEGVVPGDQSQARHTAAHLSSPSLAERLL